MNRSIGVLVTCVLGLVACNVEHYDDCDDYSDDGGDFGGSYNQSWSQAMGGHTSSVAGTASTKAGSSYGASGGSDSVGEGGSVPDESCAGNGNGGDGGEPPVVVPPPPCEKERDCAPGFNCALDTHQCLPAEQETCGELETELACTNRSDCTPVYGGTNCSCGKDCECHGGEPGCVCESFQFFLCQDAP